MKRILFISLFFIGQIVLFGQNNKESLLAQQYFIDGEFDKAAEIYQKLYSSKNGEKLYYKGYFNTLLKLEEYEKAKIIAQKSQSSNKSDLSISIDLGFVFKKLGDLKSSEIQFKKVLENIPPNLMEIKNLSDIFYAYSEIKYAIEVYKKGQVVFNNPSMFNIEIASLFASLNDKTSMITAYLEELFFRPDQLEVIQNYLQKSLTEDSHFEELERILFKRVQANKNFLPYSELLVWMYMHLGDYESAFTQARSIDINYSEDGFRILEMARIALSQKYYNVAEKAFQYVVSKGTGNPYYVMASLELINTKKERVFNSIEIKNEDLIQIRNSYNKFIKDYGKNNTTALASQELSKLYAFYFHEVDSAIIILDDVLTWVQIKGEVMGMTKLQLGDYYLLNGDHWESTLLYTQVEKAFKGTPVGEEAKFRNAKLSYYKGDFEWSQTQLKFLKASTDQLISNDAIDLSVFIADNLNLDTTDHTMVLFAAAELFYFQNKLEDAVVELEGIKLLYPGHKLTDDVYFALAKIDIKRRNYVEAIQKLEYIVKYHEKEILADDALFKIGELYEVNLKDKENAIKAYQDLIINYSNSTFAVEARKRFRILRGDNVN